MNHTTTLKSELHTAFSNLRENEPLARYTSARIGGPAEFLIEAHSSRELTEAAEWLWAHDLVFRVLGGGSNVLVSDLGLPGVTLLNHAKSVEYVHEKDRIMIEAESGANLGLIARQAAAKGLTGLEWAAGIPGTLGGAIVGNAGAHGSDMSAVVTQAQGLRHSEGKQTLFLDDLGFEYRASNLKSQLDEFVVLSASLQLMEGIQESIQQEMDKHLAHRRKSQPPGASMGSMFKNPPDDYAGRLIEASGLKGKKIGAAQISPLHANFFINLGKAKSADVHALLMEAQNEVHKQFGIRLEFEIALIGDWDS